MRFKIHGLVLLAIFCLCHRGTLLAEESGWTENMEAAMKQAAAEDKGLLLNFTGSDWCIWCKRLEKEVFGQEEFLKEAQKQFVLVKLDFPNDKSKLDKKTIEQNQTWKSKFGVSGFPTVYLTDAKGRPYAKTGYAEGGPKNYLPMLKEKREIGVKLDAAFAKAKQAEGIERAKLLDEALALVDDDMVESHYGEVVKEIVKLDNKNEAGLRAKHNAKRDKEERRELLARIKFAKRSLKPDAAIQFVDKVLKDYWLPIETKLQVLEIKLKLLESAERQEDAVALLDGLIADQRVDEETRDELRVKMIYSMVKVGEVDRALRRLDDMAKENKSRRHELLFSKGELLDRLERHEEALAVYDLAGKASLDGEFRFEVHMAKADSLASLDRVDDAVTLLDNLLTDKNTPSYFMSDTLIQKAMILRDAGRIEDAEQAETQAIDSVETEEEKADLRKLIETLRRVSK